MNRTSINSTNRRQTTGASHGLFADAHGVGFGTQNAWFVGDCMTGKGWMAGSGSIEARMRGRVTAGAFGVQADGCAAAASMLAAAHPATPSASITFHAGHDVEHGPVTMTKENKAVIKPSYRPAAGRDPKG